MLFDEELNYHWTVSVVASVLGQAIRIVVYVHVKRAVRSVPENAHICNRNMERIILWPIYRQRAKFGWNYGPDSYLQIIILFLELLRLLRLEKIRSGTHAPEQAKCASSCSPLLTREGEKGPIKISKV